MPGNDTHSPELEPAPGAPSPSSSHGRAVTRLRSLGDTPTRVWAAATAVLVLAGVLGSVLGARAVARSEAKDARVAFHAAAADVTSTLQRAIQHEEDLVVNASAFIAGNPNVTPAEFDGWVQSTQAMRRYPELQVIGFVKLVPASALAAFEAHIGANPLRALGPESVYPREPFHVLPAGRRPYYCLAVAGLARNAATVVPGGLDYCAGAPTLIKARDEGLAGYAPFATGRGTLLGIESPVYRGGTVPPTGAARRRAFIGWLGELLAPHVVLARALGTHPGLAVVFRYDSRVSHVAFTRGLAPAGAQSTSAYLQVGRAAGLPGAHEGWSVRIFGAAAAGGVLDHPNSVALMVGGIALSVALGLLLFVLGTGRRRALALVHEQTRELSHQAAHDALTGLPNRALVLDRAEQLLARLGRRPEMLVGALYIDLDGFKDVNDSLGHAAGDQVLRVVGERLKRVTRAQDTVGRLGGDEFVMLVESHAGEQSIELLADRVTETLREPVEIDLGRKVAPITASIGVAIGRYASADVMLRDADLALYAAKAAGSDRYALFDASMQAGEEARLELAGDLSGAVQGGQFFLLFQPICELPSRELAGVEALVRWRHPTRGVLLPDAFVPLAEESGLIVPIGRWVLDEACRQAAAWAEHGTQVSVSVNVSAYQLGRRGFAEEVRGALARSRIEPSSLILEITETTVMRNVPAACKRLEAIKALGVRVAIDDFGTGYASLSQLPRLPIDILKIDQSFVAALNDGGRSNELLAAILGVGQALSLTVIAEGVEEQAQITALEAMGCKMAQGFLFGRPSPAREIIDLPRSGAVRPTVGS